MSISSESPCRRLCKLNANDVCTGCGRLAKEIFKWTSLSESDRIIANQQAKERLKKLKQE